MAPSPTVSIGICAHNEEATIGTLLDQVLNEEIPVAEVIVVVAGEDATADIVSDAAHEHDEIVLVEEEEAREGQIAAQNKILSRASGEALLLVDGDGTMRPGSLEALYDQFDGENIVAGKEVPVTEESFAGDIIAQHGAIHHEFCCSQPRFSTHMGIFPTDLVDQFPDIVLDDVYVEHRAMEEGRELEYVPEAVKYHHLPNTYRFFFHQQKKNWAGRFQAEKRGYQHTKPPHLLALMFLRQMAGSKAADIPALLALGGLEVAAYATGRFHQLTGNFPVAWWRPGSE